MDALSIHEMRRLSGLKALPLAPPELDLDTVVNAEEYSSADELAMEARILATELTTLIEDYGFVVPNNMKVREVMQLVRDELLTKETLSEQKKARLSRIVEGLARVSFAATRLEEQEVIQEMGQIIEANGYEIPVTWNTPDLLQAILEGCGENEAGFSAEVRGQLVYFLEGKQEQLLEYAGAPAGYTSPDEKVPGQEGYGAGHFVGRVLRHIGRFTKGAYHAVTGKHEKAGKGKKPWKKGKGGDGEPDRDREEHHKHKLEKARKLLAKEAGKRRSEVEYAKSRLREIDPESEHISPQDYALRMQRNRP